MRSKSLRWSLYVGVALVAIAGAIIFYASRSDSLAETTLTALAEGTHFHGIAVADPTRLYLATHHGLYLVEPDGKARRISATRDDFMGFTPHPADPSILYASGHPANGGNLGFIESKDGGRSWARISMGVHGPVDFHQMDVSKADPNIIYGVYGDLQRSADAGRSWTRVGSAPIGIIALATSSQNADVLYAATRTGLQRSTDGGQSWQTDSYRTTTVVYVTRGGTIYAFVVGTGLMRAVEKDIEWQVLNNDFGEHYVVHFAADPADQQRLYAVTLHSQTHAQNVIASRDGGSTWTRLGRE